MFVVDTDLFLIEKYPMGIVNVKNTGYSNRRFIKEEVILNVPNSRVR